MKKEVKVKSLSCVWLFVTPWTVAHQVPPSFGLSRQEYSSGLPLPSPGVFPTQGLNPGLSHCRQTFTIWATREVITNKHLSLTASPGEGDLMRLFCYTAGKFSVCFWILQFSSVAQSCSTLCNPMNRSTPGLPVHHQLPEFTQTHVHHVGDAIQPSHPLSSPSPPAPNPSQHQGLFQWVNSSHEVAKVLEFQPQHQSFQWTPRTGLL